MIALSHKVPICIKEAAIIKITDASAGDASKQAGIIRCNFEEMPNSEWGERGKSIYD